MKQNPTVSLIMTTYNCADHFRKSMDSLLAQDYPAMEIVVVDGGSEDGNLDLIRELEEKVKTRAGWTLCWISEPDRGIYDGMNKGIRMASGDFIAVFNDLFACTDAVSRMIGAVLENPGCIGAHADLLYFDEATGRVVREWKMGEGDIHSGWLPAHPTLYLKKEVYEAYGLYDLSYRSSSDYEFMVRVLKDRSNRLAYVPEVIIRMFYGGTSNSGFFGYFRNTMEAWSALRHNKVPFAGFIIVLRILRTMAQFRK